MGRRSKILLIVLLFLLAMCGRNGSGVKHPFSEDPFISSFWDSDVKYLIKELGNGDADTICFDRAGNMVSFIYSGIVDETRTFDKYHRMTSLSKGDDIFRTYYFQYDTFQENIIQRVLPMNKFKSDFDSIDIDQRNVSYVVTILDEEDMVGNKIDFYDQKIIKLEYDNALLMKRSERYLYTTLDQVEWRFFLQQGQIDKIRKAFRQRSLGDKLFYKWIN